MIRFSDLSLSLKMRITELALFQQSPVWPVALELFAGLGLLLVGLFQLGLYARRRHDPDALYIGGSSLLAAAGTFLTSEQVMLRLFPHLDADVAAKVGFILLCLSVPLLAMFLGRTFPAEFSTTMVTVAQIIGLVLGPVVILTPASISISLLPLFQIIILVSGAYGLYRLAVAAHHRRPEAIVWLCGLLGLWLAATNDMLVASGVFQSDRLLPLGLLILTVSQGIVLTGRMGQALTQAEAIAHQTAAPDQAEMQQSGVGTGPQPALQPRRADSTGPIVAALETEQASVPDQDRAQLERFVSDRTAALVRLNLMLQNEIAQHEETAQALSKAMTAAETASRAKDAFLAHMSHELRTPLSSILGYAQILKRDKSLPTHQREFVTVIQQSGEYLLTLLNDILDFSKIEAGQMELRQSDFNLPNMLKNIIDIFQIRAQEKDINFVFSASQLLPSQVKGDEKRLRQVLINLLGNAIKFTAQGSVTLRVDYQPQGLIRFQVEDTGIGIESEYLQEIFYPFRQVGAHQGNVQGTGLGLTISKRLVEMMKSELSVRSKPGWGSTFWFDVDLPVVTTRLETIKFERPPVVGYRGQRRKILVIGSAPDSKMWLVKMLSSLGFVLAETSLDVGLEQAKNLEPDALLINCSNRTVLNCFVEKVRQTAHLRNTAIICLDHDSPPLAKIDRRTAYLPKPVNRGRLLDQLDRLLRLRWIFAPTDDNVLPTAAVGRAHRETDLIGPPPAYADLLFDLSLKGDVKRIKEQVAALATIDEAYRPFVTELGGLLRNYQMNQIRELLKPYVSAK